MSNLNEFIATIKTGGLARANRFSVVIPFPSARGGEPRKVLILCDSATMPGVTMATAQQRIWGEVREMPYEAIYDTVTFSFYVDTNLGVKNLFEEWFQLIRNPTSRAFNYYNSYITDVQIMVHPINDNETAVHTVTLYEAYPKILQPVTLDYSSKDVMKYSVSMNYKWYETSNNSQQDVTTEIANPNNVIPSILTSKI